jgi:hypothetical protein
MGAMTVVEMSEENAEQSTCGPGRSYDPLPALGLLGEDRCEVGLTGRATDIMLNVTRSLN